MNATQRKKIEAAISALEQQKNIIDELHTELNDKFDAMSESAQEGEKGEALQQVLTSLEDFEGNIDSCIDNLETARDA